MNRSRLLLPFAFILATLIVFASPAGAQTSASNKDKTEAKPAADQTALLDINTASKTDLTSLPGIGDAYAQKIIAGRPYNERTSWSCGRSFRKRPTTKSKIRSSRSSRRNKYVFGDSHVVGEEMIEIP